MSVFLLNPVIQWPVAAYVGHRDTDRESLVNICSNAWCTLAFTITYPLSLCGLGLMYLFLLVPIMVSSA